MKSNSIKYQVRQLCYYKGKLIDDTVYDEIFYNLEEVNFFISLAKYIDVNYMPEFCFMYITEVL